MDRVRVGVVGVGGIFRGGHLPAYPNVREARLVSLCDISEDALREAEKLTRKLYLDKSVEAKREGNAELCQQLKGDAESMRLYKNVDEMLSSEELDLVDICTPTKFHSPIAIKSLSYGVNVMVEKPMARTYLECLEVMEAVRDSGKLYQHNENWLYDPLWYNVRKFIESGVLGELQLTFLAASHGGPEWESWFWDPEVAGGGALLDNGVHAITCSWFLAGFDRKPVMVKAAEPYGICIRMKTRILRGMFKPFDVEDDAHVVIRFENRDGTWSTAHVEGSWSYRDSLDTCIIGTSGILRPIIREGEILLEITDASGGKREVNVGKADWIQSFQGEIRNMCNCILNRAKPLCNEYIGAETTAIVQSAYLSQKRGKKPVTLDEFKRYAQKIREKEGKNASNVLLKDLLEGIRSRGDSSQFVAL